jgi:hypothetical protein
MGRSKIKFGVRPKTFKSKVVVSLPGEEEGVIEVVYKYRTRKEYGDFMDSVLEGQKSKASLMTDDQVMLSIASILQQKSGENADMILQIAEGWDLEYEFTYENVAQLCDELPGVAMAVVLAYREACIEGRLGN